MATYRRWARAIVDETGLIIPAVTVTVYEAGTTDAADIYEDKAATTPKANPFVTGADGIASFFIDIETYPEMTIVLAKAGYDFTAQNDVLTYVGWAG